MVHLPPLVASESEEPIRPFLPTSARALCSPSVSKLQPQLEEAVKQGDILRARALVRRGSRLLGACPELPDGGSGNLIDWALLHNKAETAIRLLKLGDSLSLGKKLAQSTYQAVYRSAQRGFNELLCALLERGALPGQCSSSIVDGVSERQSALQAASIFGNEAGVAALIAAGAWDEEEEKEMVLRYAQQWGFKEGSLVSCNIRQGCSASAPDEQALRLKMQEAIWLEDITSITALARRGAPLLAHYRCDRAIMARVSASHRPQAKIKVGPVDWAALEGRPAAALRLLEVGDELGVLPVDFVRAVRFALHISSRHGGEPRWRTLLTALLERGIDSGQQDAWGRSALHLAAMHGHTAVAEELLKHGGWSREESKDEVLRLAISQRISAIINIAGESVGPDRAIDVGGALADVQTRKEFELVQARLVRDMARAVQFGDLIAAKAILGRGVHFLAETELSYGFRGNFLDLAVCYEHEAVALALLELGDERGLGVDLAISARHAVFWAIRHGYSKLLRALLDRGVDVAQTDALCGSALRFAVEQRRADMAAILLRADAWKREPERDRVQQLLSDWQMTRSIDCSTGRGLGADTKEDAQELAVAWQQALCQERFGSEPQSSPAPVDRDSRTPTPSRTPSPAYDSLFSPEQIYAET